MSHGARAEESCIPSSHKPPPATVTFSSLVGDSVYSPDTSVKTLAHLTNPKAGSTTLGLTRARTEFRVHAKVWQIDLGGGQRCVGLARAEATWQLFPQKVDIASEYPPGGCNYRIVRDHEDQHVTINREGFQRWSPKAEEAFRQAVLKLKPIKTMADQAVASAAFRIDLERSMVPAFANFVAELAIRHGAIDTPANYRRTQLMCPRW